MLVSFCNFSAPRATAIFRLEPGSDNLSEARMMFPHRVEGCTGMTGDGARIYVLSVSEGAYHLMALTRNELEFVFCQPLPEVKDGHSLLAKDRKLYVVSTGTDEIFRYNLAPQGVSDPRVIWRATVSGTDTHHVNSITEWQGNLVASAFGPKFGTLWTSALEGYIHDISRDMRIKSGVYHPHSLSVRGDRLYYLESQRKLLCSLGGPLFSVPGYPRGVCWLSDDLVCIGSNVGRGLSKSTGLIANPADPGKPSGSCGITVGDVKTGRRVKQLDLGWVGGEIYDILVENANQG
jgi:hypothetical protein